MKANTPKRKIFDAVDLLTEETPAQKMTLGGVETLPVDSIIPFHAHPFHLYEGERLDDMVKSVQEHGILAPVIVWKHDGICEMLAGHNRLNAARIAGLTEIPAIVKTEITEEEAYVYVIETNLIQRSFTDLSTSEKAAVLAERYDKVFYQRKREDIINELKELAGDTKGGHDVHHSKNRDGLGEEYGLSGRSVARLLRVNELMPELKEKLDAGKLNLVAAVQLSYVPEDVQRAVAELDKPISKDMAVKIREEGKTAEDVIQAVISGTHKMKAASDKDRLKKIRNRYFSNAEPEEMWETIQKALDAYFERGERVV